VTQGADDEDEMSKWDDRVTNHAVIGLFTTILGTLENLPDDKAALAPEDIDRLMAVVVHVRDRVTRTPAELVTMPSLNNFQQALAPLVTEIGNFTSNGNAGHLDNANNHADALLDWARLLPTLPPDAAADAIAADADRVRGLVSTVVTAAEAEVSRLRENTAAVQQAAAEAKDSFLEEATSAEQAVAELRAQMEVLRKRLEDALNAQQAKFDEAERERAEAAQEAVRKSEVMFGATDTELQQNAEGTLQALRKLNKDAEELVGAIGINGVAAGYNETATKEQRVANIWRIGTVVVAVVSALFLGSALFIDHGAEGSWERLVTRLVVALSFAGVAAYCGRQSAEHRKVEREARARHLQLAALNPYLANMPKEDLVRLKAELAPGYFAPAAADGNGNGNGQDADKDPPLSTAQFVELVKILLTKGGSAN
jgi:hypothetical protein